MSQMAKERKKKKERERTVEQTKTNTACLNFRFFPFIFWCFRFFLVNLMSFLVCSYCLMFDKRGQIIIRYFCFIFFKCRKEKTFWRRISIHMATPQDTRSFHCRYVPHFHELWTSLQPCKVMTTNIITYKRILSLGVRNKRI